MNLIKKVFDAMGAALAVIVIAPWIMWLVKYTFDNSRTIEDVLPNVLTFILNTLLLIVLVVVLGWLLVLGISALMTRLSPTPWEYVTESEEKPPTIQNTETPTQSRGGKFDVAYEEQDGILTGTFIQPEFGTLNGVKQGSEKAQETYKESEERKLRLQHIDRIDRKIQAASVQ